MGLLMSKEESFDFEAELKKQTEPQSVVVGGEGEEKDGLGPIRRNIRFKDALVEVPFQAEDEEAKAPPADTLWALFERGVRVNPDGNALGVRPADGDGFGAYEWTSYTDARTEAVEVGAGLRQLGLSKGDKVGICSVNRPEWTAGCVGLYSQGLVTCALYDTFGSEAVTYIIDHAETKVVMCSVDKLPLILECAKEASSVKTVVVFDYQERYKNESERVTDAMREQAKEAGVELVPYTELRAKGREAGAEPDAPSTDDLAFIMYTSGTTGMPKGVMLSHKNITACIAGFSTTIVTLTKDDVHFSYLPLAHIFETAVQGAIWGVGASIGFYSGHIKRLTADLGELHPTVFPGVPRVFQKIYDKLMDTVSKGGALGKFFFKKALAQDAAKVRRGQKLDMAGFSQAKVFGKIRGKLGLDRCRLIVTGAAPCPPYIMEFLRVVVAPSAGVVQGYGMTETAAALTTSAGSDHTLGHVGPPLASAEIRLRDVEEMGYTTANNCGEVIARGPSIFSGYWKNEEATNSTLQDGWIGTGDIGRWNANGTLSIIDRKKNIFKLAQGEYIASEKVEGVYARLPGVNQIWVYGNSYKSKIVAVVVPAWNHWDPIFRSKGWWGAGPEADEKNPERTEEYRAHFQKTVEENADAIKAILKAEFKDVEEAAGLRGFEKLSGIVLEGEIDVLGTGFNVANDTLTPTFKLRRPFLLKRYLERLRQLYTDLGEAPKEDEKW